MQVAEYTTTVAMKTKSRDFHTCTERFLDTEESAVVEDEEIMMTRVGQVREVYRYTPGAV